MHRLIGHPARNLPLFKPFIDRLIFVLPYAGTMPPEEAVPMLKALEICMHARVPPRQGGE